MALADRVRIGAALPQIFINGRVDTGLIRESAQQAERLGFESLWIQEQLFGRAAVLEPVTLLAYAAAVTSRARLGCSVFVMPRRDPVVLAKQLSSLDQLSHGRLIVGVGMGGVGFTPLDRPVLRLAEGVRVMRALWADGTATIDGKLWQLKDAPMNPKPAQRPGPPVWFGAVAPKAMQRAARMGDGWAGGGGYSAAEFAAQAAQVRGFLGEEGRDPKTFTVSKRQYVVVDADDARAERRIREWFGAYYLNPDIGPRVTIWGPPERVAEQLDRLADAGANHLLLAPLFDFSEQLSALAEVAGLAGARAR